MTFFAVPGAFSVRAPGPSLPAATTSTSSWSPGCGGHGVADDRVVFLRGRRVRAVGVVGAPGVVDDARAVVAGATGEVGVLGDLAECAPACVEPAAAAEDRRPADPRSRLDPHAVAEPGRVGVRRRRGGGVRPGEDARVDRAVAVAALLVGRVGGVGGVLVDVGDAAGVRVRAADVEVLVGRRRRALAERPVGQVDDERQRRRRVTHVEQRRVVLGEVAGSGVGAERAVGHQQALTLVQQPRHASPSIAITPGSAASASSTPASSTAWSVW